MKRQPKAQSASLSSSDEAIEAGVHLLRQLEEAQTLEGIRQGLEDMKAGRGRPAEDVFAEIRRDFALPLT